MQNIATRARMCSVHLVCFAVVVTGEGEAESRQAGTGDDERHSPLIDDVCPSYCTDEREPDLGTVGAFVLEALDHVRGALADIVLPVGRVFA